MLKVGIALREEHYGQLPAFADAIDCVEVTLEQHLYRYDWLVEYLNLVSQRIDVMVHTLRASVGSVDGIHEKYLANVKNLTSDVPTIQWISEHMSLTTAGNVSIPHFINIPYNDETLDVVVRNIKKFQASIGKPVIFENIPYDFNYPETQMHECEFLRKVIEQTGCGLLFDASNLYANSVNLKFDLENYLKKYPFEHVYQLHFNGGEFEDAYYHDTHAHDTLPEIWRIIEYALRHGKPQAMILERDDNLGLEAYMPEIEKARGLAKKLGVAYGA